MAYAVAVTLALGLAAAAAERGFRLADGQARGAWVAAVAGAMVLPAAGYLVGPVSPLSDVLAAVGASGSPRTGDAGGSGLTALLASVFAGGGSEPAGSAGSGPAAVARELAVSLEGPLLLLWGLLSAILGARLTVGWWRACRRPGWRRERIDGRPVLVAPDVGPALVGLLRTEVVVPEWFREISPDLRELALRHEEEHRRAGDPWLALGAELALVLMPWNPALHWTVRRLRRAIELDCDQRIVRDGVDRRRYGRLLVAVGGRSGGGRGLGRAVALTEGTTELERRVTMLRSKEESWKGLRMAGAAGLAVAALALACETPVPPEEEVTEAAEAHVEGEITTAGQIQAVGDGIIRPGAPGAPVMVIDGVIAEEPVDLDALDVARMEVVKGEAARELYGERAANGVVMITTGEGGSSGVDRDSEAAGGTRGTIRLRSAEPESGTWESTVGVSREEEVGRPAESLRADSSLTARSSWTHRGVSGAAGESPLVIVDGVIMGREADLEEINALDIESIEVVKGEAALEAYGERARDGLIRITTKGGG
jgi:hypothetical protein